MKGADEHQHSEADTADTRATTERENADHATDRENKQKTTNAGAFSTAAGALSTSVGAVTSGLGGLVTSVGTAVNIHDNHQTNKAQQAKVNAEKAVVNAEQGKVEAQVEGAKNEKDAREAEIRTEQERQIPEQQHIQGELSKGVCEVGIELGHNRAKSSDDKTLVCIAAVVDNTVSPGSLTECDTKRDEG